MPSPTEVILDHLETVRVAVADTGDHAAAWHLLSDTCPTITAAMSCEHFKVTVPVILDVVARLSAPPPTPARPPKTFMGWSVQAGAQGYVRLFRRLGGKVRSIYIGKTWDPEKASTRIAAFTPREDAA